ncbi:MAG: hypothetical protein K9M45_00275 [Kiritimatiellales bacterium]|nr:hypothetical protein [Kiritimatiellales bacterium]
MSPGIKEIIILVIAVLALFLGPRMMRRRAGSPATGGGGAVGKSAKSTGYLRLAFFVSIAWVAIVAFLLKPWDGNAALFAAAGIGPVALGWGINWVLQGFK